MRPEDEGLAQELSIKLKSFHDNQIALPGILSLAQRDCFIAQMIDSIKRIKYVTTIRDRCVSDHCIDATNIAFDPIKAASWYKRNGNTDEALWLIFLAIHFGKNLSTKWGLYKSFYSALDRNPSYWRWDGVINNIDELKFWLEDNEIELKLRGNFGNHRKYQSIRTNYKYGLYNTICSYINWVGHNGSHVEKINSLIQGNVNDPKILFRILYKSMDQVIGFGRTAKFDFLTMIGKLDLVGILPDSTYMQGATGPYDGAQLLFSGRLKSNLSRKKLSRRLDLLEDHLGLYFGMQVLEDAICNWQKNPSHYKHFRG